MEDKIGFLDSGIGGVTVLRECLRELPLGHYIYYSDSKNNPYGNKSKDKIIGIVEDIVLKLIDMGCSVIVLACNTASAVCVGYLRNKYKDIKFIAIEPAVKLAYDKGILGGTLIMATKGTLDSDKFHSLYQKYGRDNFYLESCEGLANMVENNQFEDIDVFLNNHLKKYCGNVSSVVLGCTHYPLIVENIKRVLGDVIFYDGSVGVAKQLRRIIEENNIKLGSLQVTFINSEYNIEKEDRFYKLLEGFYEQ